jgi:hypothetical protein
MENCLISYIFQQQLAKTKERIAELEKQLRDNLPVDVGKELEACQAKVVSEILVLTFLSSYKY